jgi:hypothetical protein
MLYIIMLIASVQSGNTITVLYLYLYLPNTDPYRLDLKYQDVLLKQLKVYEDQNVFLKALCHRWILRTSCTEPQQYSEYG